MMAEYTPRVNATMLDQFTGKTVRIIGKVMLLRGETATIDCSGSIVIQLDRNSHLTISNAVEIIGKVNPDNTVKAFSATDFGADIDFKAVEAVVEATHKYPELFYEKE